MRILWPIYNLNNEYSQYPGVMNISSLLKQNGFEVEIVPADYNHIKARLQEKATTILAYSTLTSFFQYYLKLNLQIKQQFPEVFSVYGGPHPTYFPEMIEEEGVDAVCIGEGEYPMLEMVTSLSTGKSVKSIQSWWVKEDKKIYKNPVWPLIENLDELPLPDHELFRQARPNKISQAIIMTSRGCPYKCTYCYNHIKSEIYKGKGTVIRRRSVDNVMEELRQIKENNYSFIRFMDDLFILSHKWIEEFSKKYKEQIGLPFSCLVRANYISADIAKKLKEAGCYRMTMGVEAGNDYVRNNILKRNMTKETMIKAARVIKEAGLKLTTANILAIPGGSLQTDYETLELNIRCRPDHAYVSIMQPYPRTGIYHYAKNEGLLEEIQLDAVESSFGFGFETDIKFKDKREKCLIENFHKFFSITVKFPWLLPIVKQLIKLPSNRIFNFIYLCSVNYGIHFQDVPPKIGLAILWKRTKLYKLLRSIVRQRGESDV